MPQVSVVIPTYNRRDYLHRALVSVLAQTFKDYEVLVIQNGESRNAEAVVLEFKDKGMNIRYLHEDRADPTHARNVGVSASAGEFVAFLDDDDEWLPEKLELQHRLMKSDPEVGWCFVGAEVIDSGGRSIRRLPDIECPCDYINMIRHGNFIWSFSFVMFKKECFKNVGGLNSAYEIASDYELYLKLSKNYSYQRIDIPLVRYHLHGQNLSRQGVDTWLEMGLVLRGLKKNSHPRTVDQAIDEKIKNLAVKLFDVAEKQSEAKDYASAFETFKKCFCFDPWLGTHASWLKNKSMLVRILSPYYVFLKSTLRWGLTHRVFKGVR